MWVDRPSSPPIRFGPFQVDPRTRELRKGRTRIRVPDQSIKILLALLDRAGDVVTREELAAGLWPPETVVDVEHGLNSAVRRLRDALGDSAERPVFVETVPRLGYRFVGTVEAHGDASTARAVPSDLASHTPDLEPEQAPRLAASRTSGRAWVVAAGLALIVATATYLAWRARPAEDADAEWRTVPARLTFEDGLQTAPRFSPDGLAIAYASDQGGNFDIWMRRVAGGDAVQVTRDAAADSQPAWSPDGNRIVFRSERAGGGLFVVPATGGAEERISSAGFNPLWSPDGRHILFATTRVAGLSLDLQVIDADGTSPRPWPGASHGAFGWQPGSSTVHVLSSFSGPHEPALKSWVVGATSTQSWRVADAVSREFRAQQLSVVSGESAMVSPDSGELYFVGSSRGTRGIWRIGIDASTRQVSTGPHRIGTLSDANNASLSPDGRRLVFDGIARNAQIWSYALDKPGTTTPIPETLTPDAVHAEVPTLSRDGRAFAFVLTRPSSRERRELVARLPGQAREQTIRVIQDPDELVLMPKWNHDGSQLAYGFISNAHDASAQQQIRVFDAVSGRDTALTSPHTVFDMEFPSGWTPDGKFVLATSPVHSNDPSTIARLPIAAAPAAEKSLHVITSAADVNLAQATVSPDGRWVAFRVGGLGAMAARIAVVPATGGDRSTWEFVTPGVDPADKPCWSDDGKLIYFTSGRSVVMNVWGIAFDSTRGVAVGDPFRITAFDGPGLHILDDVQRMELGVGGGRLVLPIVRPRGGLWMIERTPR
jgi:Tol biopolymer transport system component/DNA-binding winged helix-turn-helix (wHTH) protein